MSKVDIDYDKLTELRQSLCDVYAECDEIDKRIVEIFKNIFNGWQSINANTLKVQVSLLENSLNKNINYIKMFSEMIQFMQDSFSMSEEDFNKSLVSLNNSLEEMVNEKQ